MRTELFDRVFGARRYNTRVNRTSRPPWGGWNVCVVLAFTVAATWTTGALALKPPPKKPIPSDVVPKGPVRTLPDKSESTGAKPGVNPTGVRVPGPGEPRAVIKAEEPVHDFGTKWVGPILDHAFTIKNEGDATLEIMAVRPSCGCTVAGKYPRKLEPGESGEFPFKLASTKLRGKYEKGITIECNDPATPNLRLRLRGEVKQYVDLAPTSMNFGKLYGAEPREKVIKITNNTETPLSLEVGSPSGGTLEANLVEKTPGKVFELHVTAKPPFRPGPVRESVTLKTNIEAQKDIKVNIRGNAPYRLEVSPSVLTLEASDGRKRSKAKDQGFTRVLRFNNYGETPAKLLTATVDDPAITVNVEEQREGKSYNIQVQFPPDYEVPERGHTITLKTDDAEKPTIEVPIRPIKRSTRTAAGKRKRPAEEMVGKKSPAFSLKTMEGKRFSDLDLNGNVTVLDFFAVNCGFCTKQIPRLETIRKEYADKGVRFVTVSQTMRGKDYSDEQVIDKIKELGFHGELVTDPVNTLGPLFKATSFPTMVVIGKTGKVEAVNIGNIGDLETRLRGQLGAMIAGKPVPKDEAVAKKPETKPKRPAEEMVGQAAPKFELTTTAGEKVSNEALAGTVTVLDFFSQRCGHCSKQIPRVEKIRKDYEAKGVRFIAIGSGGTDEELREKVNQLGYQGELVTGNAGAASSAFKVRGVPSMAILGKTGKVEAVNVGNVGDLETRMKGQLDALLAGKPLPKTETVAQKPEEKQKQKRPAEEMVGQAAPKFELTTTAGKKVSNEALAGTVTVLDFFSKTCGHCSRQIPRVEQIRKTYEEKGVRFIAVGSGGTDEEIKEKVDQLGYQGELAIDSNRAASSAFKVRGVPSMAILGKTGKVEAVNVGNVGDLETRMKGQLDALLAGKPVPEFASAAPPKPRKRPAEDMAGKPAPAFSLKTADGKTFSNAALASYPATVLNFVAPNCGFSKRQVTKVETVRAEYEQKGVRFVNVNQTFRKPYSAEEALEVFKGVGSNLELVYDDEANTVGNTFKATGYPTMFVVDKEGKIAHVNIGANPNIDTILKEQLDGLIK